MIAAPFAGLGVGLIVIVVIVVLAIVLFKAMWKVAEPNEALIISGMRSRGRAAEGVGESMGFKIVTGHGTFVIPGIQVARRLSLDAQEAPLTVNCVTRQGIKTSIEAVVIWKVGDDFASIANAARRFLDQQDKMNPRIQNVFEGHLRAICGLLTLEVSFATATSSRPRRARRRASRWKSSDSSSIPCRLRASPIRAATSIISHSRT